MGVQHYSNPDPVFTITPKVIPAVATVVNNPTLLLNRSKSPTNIAALAKVAIPKGAVPKLKVHPLSAKYCKLVGKRVKAFAVGTCKATLTVKPQKGQLITKVVTLTVKR